MRKVALYGTMAVGFATLTNLAHGGSHAGQQVTLAFWQWVFVISVVFCAPAVAAVLLWSRSRVVGAWLLSSSMSASLVFGVSLLFLIGGPDNVLPQHAGSGRTAFAVTAVLAAFSQALGAGIGVWALGRLRWAEARVGEMAAVLEGSR